MSVPRPSTSAGALTSPTSPKPKRRRWRPVPSTKAQRLLARILYWTGGHPYLTQRLCAAVAQARVEEWRSGQREEGRTDPSTLPLLHSSTRLVDRLCRE